MRSVIYKAIEEGAAAAEVAPTTIQYPYANRTQPHQYSSSTFTNPSASLGHAYCLHNNFVGVPIMLLCSVLEELVIWRRYLFDKRGLRGPRLHLLRRVLAALLLQL